MSSTALSFITYIMVFSSIYNIFNKLTHPRRSSACTGPFGLVPQELLDHIISYLADDRASLLSSALVHPTWTSISRYHIPPLTLVVTSSSRAKELTKLLRSSRETLSSSVSGIMLVGDVSFDDFPANTNDLRGWYYRKLLRALRAKGIMLRSGAVENDPSLVGLFAWYFPALSAFKVSCASYHYITSFMWALSGSFPHLAALSIELASHGLDLPDASLYGLGDLRLSVPCLRTLRLIGWNNELVRWLGDNVVGTLERLELESASVRPTCHIGEAISLIQGNKETLRDVRLSLVKRDVAFDLSGLVHLENLEVTSGMGDVQLALDGWRLSRSLKRVYVRDALRVFVRSCGMRSRPDTAGEILLEGEELQRALGM